MQRVWESRWSDCQVKLIWAKKSVEFVHKWECITDIISSGWVLVIHHFQWVGIGDTSFLVSGCW